LANHKLFGRLSLMQIDDLPNDINSLKKIIIQNNKTITQYNKTITQHNKTISQHNKTISQRDLEIQNLMDTIKILQRRRFAPTSESSKDQQNLFNELEELNQTDDELVGSEEIKEEPKNKPKSKKRGKRKPIADSIPRVDNIIRLPESELEGMKEIGEEVSEQLVIDPAKVHVLRTIRKKYAPIDVNSDKKIITAPAPKVLLPKTMASSSLIAYIITSKICRCSSSL